MAKPVVPLHPTSADPGHTFTLPPDPRLGADPSKTGGVWVPNAIFAKWQSLAKPHTTGTSAVAPADTTIQAHLGRPVKAVWTATDGSVGATFERGIIVVRPGLRTESDHHRAGGG